MQIHFTDDEKVEFLLSLGYMIMDTVEEYEHNIYQNQFITKNRVIIKAYKEEFDDLDRAFEKEIKNKLLNR